MRTKLVIMIRIDGAIDSTVIKAMICTMRSVKRPLPLRSMDKPPFAAAAVAAAGVAAKAKLGASKATARTSSGAKDLRRFIGWILALPRREGRRRECFRRGRRLRVRRKSDVRHCRGDDEQALARP